jgi:hypothetical protein
MSVGVYDERTGEPLVRATVTMRTAGWASLGSCRTPTVGDSYQEARTGADGVAHLTWPISDDTTININLTEPGEPPGSWVGRDVYGTDWPRARADGDPKRFAGLGAVRPERLPSRLPDLVFFVAGSRAPTP